LLGDDDVEGVMLGESDGAREGASLRENNNDGVKLGNNEIEGVLLGLLVGTSDGWLLEESEGDREGFLVRNCEMEGQVLRCSDGSSYLTWVIAKPPGQPSVSRSL